MLIWTEVVKSSVKNLNIFHYLNGVFSGAYIYSDITGGWDFNFEILRGNPDSL
jgi:hypothetical protein